MNNDGFHRKSPVDSKRFATLTGALSLVVLATMAGMGLSASTALAQERGGTFIKAIENEPATLDYLFGKDFGALTVTTNLYNRLFWLDFDFNP